MELRIIAGLYQKRKLLKYNHKNIKPTKNIVRGAIFNIIRNDIKNAIFLDLFAGSGVIGIEAISRGANFVYLIEKEKEIANIIQKNLKKFKIRNAKIVNSDYQKAIFFLKNRKINFDIVMIDPPYTYSKKEYINIINLLIKNKIFKKKSIIILESKIEISNNILNNKLTIVKQRRYGKTLLTILEYSK